jgi:hypothetical protein
MKEHLKSFREYYSLSAKLIDGMSKDDLAECARLMALQLAHYEQKFGNLPECEVLALLGVAELSTAEVSLLRNGMMILTGYLDAVHEESDSGSSLH